MKQEERLITLFYLKNVLKRTISAKVRSDLVSWAKGYSRELFRAEFERLWARARGKVENAIPGQAPAAEAAIDEQYRLLKKMTSADGPSEAFMTKGRLSILVNDIAESFRLKGGEREVMRLFVCAMRLPALDDLIHAVSGLRVCRYVNPKYFGGLGLLTGLTAGAVERCFRLESSLLARGLFSFDDDDDDGDIEISSPMRKIVNAPGTARRGVMSLVLEEKARAKLTRADFAHLDDEYEYLVRLLAGTLDSRAPGVNILLYGPPGTGKTELAKTLCAEIKADLYPISETSVENSRRDRLPALQMAKTLVTGDPKAVLLLDEAEDVFSRFNSKEGSSKLFMNRLLEKNSTAIIWVSNSISHLDPAYLRRFTYALYLDTPPLGARTRIWRSELAKNKIKMPPAEVERLAKSYVLPPAFAVNAIRSAKLVGDSRAIERTLNSLDYAITGRRKPPKVEKTAAFNPALLNTDTDLGKLTEQILKKGRLRISFCLFGAPGTGKSEFARYLAGKMGLEVLHQRASDLISMYVGETEQKIAAAFHEARRDGKMLIFDEADSFLQERGLAQRSWEISQVNEMLTWMESHPYPFVCTTNLMEALDKASLRRFTFKIKYDYLTQGQIRLAFRHFFNLDHQLGMEGLTPGDFAVVADKAALMDLNDPDELAALLAKEQEAKGIKSAKMGF